MVPPPELLDLSGGRRPPPGPKAEADGASTALSPDASPTPASPQRRRSLPTAPQLLRLMGGGLLVASASTFMFQRWDAGDDVLRYLLLLGQTVLLAGLGLFLGARARENRGARTFLGLLLIITAVHFAVLGGLVYSCFAGGGLALPQVALWQAPSALAALGLVALGVLVLAPCVWLGFEVFARGHGRFLATVLLALGGLLLVPVREPLVVVTLLTLGCVALAWVALRMGGRSPAFRTSEGRFSLAVLALPLAVLAGRTVWLYSPGAAFWGASMCSFGLLGYTLLGRWLPERYARLQACASALVALGALVLSGSLDWPDALVIPMLLLPMALALFVLGHFARGAAGLHRQGAAFACGLALPLQLVLHPGAASALLCVGAAVVLGLVGMGARQRLVVLCGLVPGALGFLRLIFLAVSVEGLSHWASLTAIGAGFVLLASLLEKRRARIAAFFSRARHDWATWQY